MSEHDIATCRSIAREILESEQTPTPTTTTNQLVSKWHKGDKLLWLRQGDALTCYIERVCADGHHAIIRVNGWQGTYWEKLDCHFTLTRREHTDDN